MRYFLWSDEAASKFGYAIYEIDGEEKAVTGVYGSENWREKYLWADAILIAQSENSKFIRSVDNSV